MVESCPLSCGGNCCALWCLDCYVVQMNGLLIYTLQSCSITPNTLNLPNTSRNVIQKLMLQVFYFGLPKPSTLHDILFVPIGAKDDEVSGWS